MAIYITGDTHGMTDLNKVIIWYNVNKDKLKEDDILIICGDVCAPPFYGVPEDKNALNIFKTMHIQIAYVDGNHENFEKLNKLPVEEWNGGKVHRVTDNVVHLMRGQVFNIENKKILSLGGATSPDRYRRIEGLDYFREEDIMTSDIDETINNLKKVNNNVDIIITHTIGKEFIYRKMYTQVHVYDEYMGGINNFLDYINDEVKHKDWYFGHFHLDCEYHQEIARKPVNKRSGEETINTIKHAMYNLILKID